MSPLMTADDHIAQARQLDGIYPALPWSSFADFFKSRISDHVLADRPFLIYYDDDRPLHCTYSYAEFGTMVQRAVTFLHDQVGLRRGDRLATILFNHDITVVLYFAAWSLGITIVPINVDEPTDKMRFILEHSEASAVCCWHTYVEEVKGLQRDLPALRHVVVVKDDGFMENKIRGARGEANHSSARPRPCLSCRFVGGRSAHRVYVRDHRTAQGGGPDGGESLDRRRRDRRAGITLA